MFLKSVNIQKDYDNLVKKKILKCACNNCELDFCFTEFSCYAASDYLNCSPENPCYGCFNNFIQTLQVRRFIKIGLNNGDGGIFGIV